MSQESADFQNSAQWPQLDELTVDIEVRTQTPPRIPESLELGNVVPVVSIDFQLRIVYTPF